MKKKSQVNIVFVVTTWIIKKKKLYFIAAQQKEWECLTNRAVYHEPSSGRILRSVRDLTVFKDASGICECELSDKRLGVYSVTELCNLSE